MSAKYACIAEHRGAFPVRLMCRVLAVSPAGFYAAQGRPPSARTVADARLRVHVRAVHATSRGTYGAPRVTHALQHAGVPVGRHRVARLMQADGLAARPRRRFVATTQSAHADPIAPNQLRRAFTVGGAVDRVWVADATYVPTAEGWLYLTVVLDLASRRVVGWAAGAALTTALMHTAFQRAVATRQPSPGLIHHSDRGSQYASQAYQAALRHVGAITSMSRAGDCWDNAVAESFFATLEWELLQPRRLTSRAETTRALAAYIDGWYNLDRLHSSLGYRSPQEFERFLHDQARVA